MVNYMVCLDGSDNSKAAFYTTIAFMKKQQPTLNTENKDHLFLLNVVDDVRVSNSYWWSHPDNAYVYLYDSRSFGGIGQLNTIYSSKYI